MRLQVEQGDALKQLRKRFETHKEPPFVFREKVTPIVWGHTEFANLVMGDGKHS